MKPHRELRRPEAHAVWTAALAALLFAVNIRNIGALNGPVIFNDEMGYLGAAATLTGRDWSGVMGSAGWYGYGWSLVLVPLLALFSDMGIIYRCINVLNALLVVGVFLMQRHVLQKLFPEAGRALVTAAAACVCFYPSVLVNTSIAWCETWLLFVYTGLTVLLLHLARRARPGQMAAFGALLGYFYVCHNRMIAVVIAGCMVAAALCLGRVVRKRDALYFCVSLAVCLALAALVKQHLVAANWSEAGLPASNDVASTVERIRGAATTRGLANLLGVFCGQIIYVCVATYGMAPVGLAVCVYRTVRALRARRTGEAAAEMWLALAFLGTLAVSTLFMGAQKSLASRRLDHIYYGRYVEPVTVLLIACGLLSLAGAKREGKWSGAFRMAYAALVGAGALGAFTAARQLRDPLYSSINTPGLAVYAETFSNVAYVVFPAVLCGLIGLYTLAALLRGKRPLPYLALAGFAAVGVIGALTTDATGTMMGQSYRGGDAVLTETIAACDTGDTPLYVFGSMDTAAYFQCMLVDRPLRYSRPWTLEAAPDDVYYAIVPAEEYYVQGFTVGGERLAQSRNTAFLRVDKGAENANTRLPVPLEMLNLADIAGWEGDHIHIAAGEEGYALYGPSLTLEKGQYTLLVDVALAGAADADSWGQLYVYSLAQDRMFGEVYLRGDMADGGVCTVEIPFTIDAAVSDLQLGWRTAAGVQYDLYGLTLEKNYVYEYRLDGEAENFTTSGFAGVEPGGSWTSVSGAAVDCYLPAVDYVLTVELGYDLPLEELGLETYTAGVYMNDTYLGSITVRRGEEQAAWQFDVPEACLKGGPNSLSVRCDRMWSPADYGQPDTRTLGICVRRILFTPRSQTD